MGTRDKGHRTKNFTDWGNDGRSLHRNRILTMLPPVLPPDYVWYDHYALAAATEEDSDHGTATQTN